MHQRIGWKLALLLCLAVLASAAWPHAHAQEPDQAVQPATGTPGTQFAFYATGFGNDNTVVFWAIAPDGSVLGDPSYRTRSASSGRADWQWIAPPNAQPGPWTMYAERLGREDVNRSLSFTIAPPGDPAAPQPTDAGPPRNDPAIANAAPPVVTPGTGLAFYATGFARLETVGLWYNAPDGRVYDGQTTNDRQDYVTRANREGRADWEWITPTDAAPGIWQAIAQGNDSATQRIVYFEVRPSTAAPGTADQPISGVSPQVAPPDTTFAFYATGFAGNERVNFWLIDPDDDTFGRASYNIRANGEGRADWRWYAPRFSTLGTWRMVAQGEVSNTARTIIFEVRVPADDGSGGDE